MSYFSDNPYGPPQPPSHFQTPSLQLPPGYNPPVWTWYVVYCVAMALLYGLVLALGIALVAFADVAAADSEQIEDPLEARIQGVVFIVLGTGLLLLYAVAPLLPKTKAAWIVGFVTIGIGLTSCCTMPASIPLLIYWLKPETKAFFRVT